MMRAIIVAGLGLLAAACGPDAVTAASASASAAAAAAQQAQQQQQQAQAQIKAMQAAEQKRVEAIGDQADRAAR